MQTQLRLLREVHIYIILIFSTGIVLRYFEIAKMQWELFVKIVNLPNKGQTSRFVMHAGY